MSISYNLGIKIFFETIKLFDSQWFPIGYFFFDYNEFSSEEIFAWGLARDGSHLWDVSLISFKLNRPQYTGLLLKKVVKTYGVVYTLTELVR